MPSFVAQDQGTHGVHRTIVDVTAQDTVVCSADDFGEQKHLQFETHAEDSSAEAKGGETPMRADKLAAKAFHGTTEQARVLLFLGKPEVHQRSNVLRASAKGLGIMRDETGGTAAIAELKLLERWEDAGEGVEVEPNRGVPIRLGSVGLVLAEVLDPAVSVHKSLCITK
jgi:hypothetical protein